MKEDSTISEIRKGLLVIAVLQVIGNKRSYAGEILQALQKSDFATQEGTLYPLLSRLKRDGYIDHEWEESKNGPPRKYYMLSAEGRLRAKELIAYISKIQSGLKKLGGADE